MNRLYGVLFWLLTFAGWARPQWWHGDPRSCALFELFLLGCAQFHIGMLKAELAKYKERC